MGLFWKKKKKKESEKSPAVAAPSVLVAAGPRFLRTMSASILAEAGWDVAQSPDVAAAAELAPLHRPELIVYFVWNTTPEVNAQLKAAAGTARVLMVGPVTVPPEELAVVAEECGAAGYLGAPFDASMLMEKVTHCRSATEADAAAWRASLLPA